MNKGIPDVGTFWLHKSGTKYEVINVCNLHANNERREEYPLLVIYRGDDGKVWSRGLPSWYRSMKPLTEDM